MNLIEQRLSAGLLATGADTAVRHAGPCARCSHPIYAGERYALLVPSGKAAHVLCVAAAP